jgi:mRNA interferase RelE/StbE
MNYSVQFRPGLERDLKRLPRQMLGRVDAVLVGLAENPRPGGCVKLTGATRLWRVRVGDWRIVYEIDDSRRIVDVHFVAHRREAYRGL